MKILQYDYILKALNLPTVEWGEYDSCSQLDSNLLWSIKVEEVPQKDSKKEEKKKCTLFEFIKGITNREQNNTNTLIGVDANSVQQFAKKKQKTINKKKQAMIYYPYYTVVKSGIVDINQERTVIEGTKGDIANLIQKNEVEVTMIFEKEDLTMKGDERFFSSEEMIPIIDYSKEIRKMVVKDLEQKKNIQLYFSYVYKTDVCLQPKGQLRLIFYQFKIF